MLQGVAQRSAVPITYFRGSALAYTGYVLENVLYIVIFFYLD